MAGRPHQQLGTGDNNSAPVMLDFGHNQAHAEHLLDELVSYAVFHFKTEDELMQKHRIDPRHHQLHLQSHGQFAMDVGKMRTAYTNGDTDSVGTLLTFLANWLVFHILDEDMALARQIKAIQSGMTPEEAFETSEGNRQDPTRRAQSRALIDLYTLMTEQNRKLMENNYELASRRTQLEDQVAVRTSELMKALQAAEASNRARNAFIANMSHEIRTPMNAIVGLTWSLKQNSTDPAQLARLKQVGDATQQLLAIINDLLDMARLESERLTLEPLDFDPAKVLQEIHSGVEAKARAKGLTLNLQVRDLPTLVRGDPIRLGQILSNFASNAAKFTEQGHINIRASRLPGGNGQIRLRFEVEDTGPGIDAVQLSRLFEPFEQLDSSSTRRHGGTGLGLAISKRLAEMMEGTVGVNSAPGKGSTFWLELPMQVVSSVAAGGEERVQATHSGSAHAVQATPTASRHRETLHRIAQLLADDDVQALPLWHQSAADLRGAFNGRAAPFEAALSAYDFAAAHALLQETLNELEEIG